MIGQPFTHVDGRTRKLLRFASIVVSALAHVSALVWIALPGHPTSSPAARAVPAVVVARPEPAPVIVELLPPDSAPAIAKPVPPVVAPVAAPVASPVAPAARRPSARSPGPAAVVATKTLSTPEVPPRDEAGASSGDGTAAHESLMTMRRPALSMGLSPHFIDEFLEHSPPPPPPPPEPGAAAHQFDASIAELDVKLNDSGYLSRATAYEIEGARLELENLKQERANLLIVPVGGGRYRNTHKTFVNEIAPDGTVQIVDKSNLQLHGLGAIFDVTDMAMRMHGDDPYASAKLHFLDKTRAERAEIGRRYRTDLLGRSAELMQANIDRVWTYMHDPRERREALFELWDDCAETGDAALLAGADDARRLVMAVIRARFRGADAYSPEELARLNTHRHSSARFAPYDDPAPPAPPPEAVHGSEPARANELPTPEGE